MANLSLDWDFCSKIDADMELEKDYFKKILLEFDSNPDLGIARKLHPPSKVGGKMERSQNIIPGVA